MHCLRKCVLELHFLGLPYVALFIAYVNVCWNFIFHDVPLIFLTFAILPLFNFRFGRFAEFVPGLFSNQDHNFISWSIFHIFSRVFLKSRDHRCKNNPISYLFFLLKSFLLTQTMLAE
jgi:hypothetical protein